MKIDLTTKTIAFNYLRRLDPSTEIELPADYEYHREYLAEYLPEELSSGDPVEFARQYLAAARRAVLHELQAIGAPDEIIEKAFAE